MVRLDLDMVAATAGGMALVAADGLVALGKTVVTHLAVAVMLLLVQLWYIQPMGTMAGRVVLLLAQCIHGQDGLVVDMAQAQQAAAKVQVLQALL
jgi:ATP-dependent protease HslVU (ClpYQ) peptidase subunit